MWSLMNINESYSAHKFMIQQQPRVDYVLVAIVTCLARRWKCLIFLRAPMLRWNPATVFPTFRRNCVRQGDWQLRLNVANSAHKRTAKRPRFDSIWAREIWRLSNRLIFHWSVFVGRTKPIASEDLNRPFTSPVSINSDHQLQCIKST